MLHSQLIEHHLPDFDTYVAFDIETTGTYGKKNGDAPAEIIEIGAVKIIGGQIAGKYSELINPGRKIVPLVSRKTGITNDMVSDMPIITSVIRRFIDFVDDNMLLGHNIKSFDLPHIVRAAEKSGIRLNSPFFDTYIYAKKLKNSFGWKKLSMEYLAKQFSITYNDAHRALNDAEISVLIYLQLKQIYTNNQPINISKELNKEDLSISLPIRKNKFIVTISKKAIPEAKIQDEIKKEAVVETRRTIAQALREWEEISASDEDADDEVITEIVEKSSKTWLSRMGFSHEDTKQPIPEAKPETKRDIKQFKKSTDDKILPKTQKNAEMSRKKICEICGDSYKEYSGEDNVCPDCEPLYLDQIYR